MDKVDKMVRRHFQGVSENRLKAVNPLAQGNAL